MSVIPDRFFRVTTSGQIEKYRNEDGCLIREDPLVNPDRVIDPEDGEVPMMVAGGSTRYMVLDAPDLFDGLRVTRDTEGEVGFLVIPLQSWTATEGYWTTDEQAAEIVRAIWQSGYEAGTPGAEEKIRNQLEHILSSLVGR
jgi:hypothetical protein